MTLRLPTLILPTLILPLALFASACDDPTAVDPRNVTFAPELGVDLDAMTRTSSGLYYQDLETGEGEPASAGEEVSVLYQGWLPDGTLFDQRQDPGNPFVFTLGTGRVIAGWDEGVAGMRPGGLRLLVIPPALGYGDRPTGPIPANSVLVFKVWRL
jgi:FKBP-type peptidyl-prolyl cis-trans isomerase FkpA